MQHKPIPLNAPTFSRKKILLFICHGAIIAGGTIGLFLYEIDREKIEIARTIALNTLVAFQIYYLWGLLLIQKKQTNHLRAYLPLVLSTIAILALQTLFTYTPWMQTLFHAAPLDIQAWFTINAVALSIFIWIIVERKLFHSLKH